MSLIGFRTFGSLLGEGISALWANKLRSALTVLGMVMGITAVIAIVSTVEGMQNNIRNIFDTMGQNTFIVTRFGIVTSWEEWEKKRRRKIITRDLIKPIREGCDACLDVSAEAYAGATIKYRSEKIRNVQLEGQTANNLALRDLDVEFGRYFTQEEETMRKNVAFIGQGIRDELFNREDPLNKTIRINGQKYTVIGVASKVGSLFGQSQDDFVYIPLGTMKKQFGWRGERVNLTVKAVSTERLQEAMDQVRVVMRSNRHVRYEDEDDFDLLTPDAILAFIDSFTQMFRIVVMALPFISIVIGGIVIMNIMMVSVTERTREIGIRKSIGARRLHISWQFLIESSGLSLIGGILGAVAGSLAGGAILNLMDITVSPTALGVILGVGISTFVGLFFGMYPAVKAARLDPIKALSYE